jgi:hypothetical protein
MAALTADRSTISKELGRSISLRVKASTTIYKGALVAVDATGYAKPAADAASEVPIGVAREGADNSSGADGAIRVQVQKGVFAFNNVGTVLTVADTGLPAYVSSDNEVEKIAGVTNNIVAGTVDDFDDGGLVYVKIHEHG